MSKVEIDAGGRRITVEHDGELAHLAETAERLWAGTEGPARIGAGFNIHTALRYEPPPVAVGGYRGRERPRVTGEVTGG